MSQNKKPCDPLAAECTALAECRELNKEIQKFSRLIDQQKKINHKHNVINRMILVTTIACQLITLVVLLIELFSV